LALARVRGIAESNAQAIASRRFERPGEADVSVGGAELLDRLERQAGELGVAQARIVELERAVQELREGGAKVAKALKAERRLRTAAEASLERMSQERDDLGATLAHERANAEKLAGELQAANAQAAMLEERMRAVWADAQAGASERTSKRGLRRLARGDG
jgi:hypothetical protein